MRGIAPAPPCPIQTTVQFPPPLRPAYLDSLLATWTLVYRRTLLGCNGVKLRSFRHAPHPEEQSYIAVTFL